MDVVRGSGLWPRLASFRLRLVPQLATEAPDFDFSLPPGLDGMLRSAATPAGEFVGTPRNAQLHVEEIIGRKGRCVHRRRGPR